MQYRAELNLSAVFYYYALKDLAFYLYFIYITNLTRQIKCCIIYAYLFLTEFIFTKCGEFE